MTRFVLLCCLVIVCLIAPVSAQGSEQLDTNKAVIIHYNIQGDILTVLDTRVIYGFPPNNLGHDEITVNIIGRDNATLKELGVDDPRILYYDSGADVLNNVNFSIILPFYSTIESVNVYNGTSGALMASADMKSAVAGFCNAHRDDKECAGISEPFPQWIIIAVLVFLAITAVFMTVVLFVRKK